MNTAVEIGARCGKSEALVYQAKRRLRESGFAALDGKGIRCTVPLSGGIVLDACTGYAVDGCEPLEPEQGSDSLNTIQAQTPVEPEHHSGNLNTIQGESASEPEHHSDSPEHHSGKPEQGSDSPLHPPIRNKPTLKPTLQPTGGSGRIDYAAIMASWNELAEELGLSQIREMTSKRRGHIKARHKQVLPVLDRIYDQIRSSAFLRGDNDRGWLIDFDFLWGRQDSWVKILEGKYSGNKNGRAKQRQAPSPDGLRRRFQALARRPSPQSSFEVE